MFRCLATLPFLVLAGCGLLGDGDKDADKDKGTVTGTDTSTDTTPEDDSGTTPTTEADADGDGFTAAQGDCDDNDGERYPGATEECDGIDNDCDGTSDENGDGIYYTDADGDTYGDAATVQNGCSPGAGYATQGGDCNDANAAVYPGAVEQCDGADNDCDGTIDEDISIISWYVDVDSDGYGDKADRVDACLQPDGYVQDNTDCDDARADVYPAAPEYCDDVDNDCDSAVDEEALDASTWYTDADRDGYGVSSGSVEACDPPTGYAGNTNDCDDSTAAVNPGAAEVCNGIDDNCDGSVDGSSSYGTFYADEDEDGYGDPSTSTVGCEAPDGYVVDGSDCDDEDADVHPTATDVWYDGVDSDCDGASDYDYDEDGYDSDDYGGDDCNDLNSAIRPGASDTPYDGLDTDCSGGSDYDGDGDGYDSDAYGGDDCDDTDAAVYPGAWESDNRTDHDCDGVLERGPTAVTAATSDLESCTTLSLDGSASSDPDGTIASYSWEVVSAPGLSDVTTDSLQTRVDVEPTVFLDLDGDYSFSLVVTDDDGNESQVDTLDLTISPRSSNSSPVADAGADQSATEYAVCWPVSYGVSYECHACEQYTFTLDGSGSTDADGEPFTYSWSVYSGSATIVGSSTNSTVQVRVDGAEPVYGYTEDAEVVVRLETTDCYGSTSASNSVTLTYTCSGIEEATE